VFGLLNIVTASKSKLFILLYLLTFLRTLTAPLEVVHGVPFPQVG